MEYTERERESVSWEIRAIVLSTGAIRDLDVKWGQAADLPVFVSSVGTPLSSHGATKLANHHAAVVCGDVRARHCGNSNLSTTGLCLSISDRSRTGLI